jgi:hypothetical protein
MTYGWADAILQPMMGVNYYEQAVAEEGKDTKDFFRLFMIQACRTAPAVSSRSETTP